MLSTMVPDWLLIITIYPGLLVLPVSKSQRGRRSDMSAVPEIQPETTWILRFIIKDPITILSYMLFTETENRLNPFIH